MIKNYENIQPENIRDVEGDENTLVGETARAFGSSVAQGIGRGIAYTLTASLLFTSGFLGRGCDYVNPSREGYSTKEIKLVEKKVGSDFTGTTKLILMEINGKKDYVLKTDGKGGLLSVVKVDKIANDLNTGENYVEGLESILSDSERVRINTKLVNNNSWP